MRKTKIICTIGPASESEEMLKALMNAGMNVARFNFSHGTHEEHLEKYERVIKVGKELHYPLATLMDTRGPEIRTGDFAEGKVILEEGQDFFLTTRDILGDKNGVSITYDALTGDVNPGDTILIDDGLIGLTVKEVTDTDIRCTVVNGGPVSNHKGINVPGVELSMPFVSEADRSDILFGIETGYDFIATSFTRSAEDVLEVRALIDDNDSKMKIIAKIENLQGVNNIREILEAADGVMVARGDLGVEIPVEEVPVIQKQIIQLAEQMGKPVITATQMLDSMMKNPRPTRAETTDVANAVYDGTTAVMLSGETAGGKYPLEALQTMDRIVVRTEQDIDYAKRLTKRKVEGLNITNAISHAACDMAMSLEADAIATVTLSGFTANMVSRYKPGCIILAGSTNQRVCRQMNILWGVYPFYMQSHETDTEMLFDVGLDLAAEKGYVKEGDTVVFTAGVPLGKTGNTNMIRVLKYEAHTHHGD